MSNFERNGNLSFSVSAVVRPGENENKKMGIAACLNI
jgi:hypothetical protein